MRRSPVVALAVTLVVLGSCRPAPGPELAGAGETAAPTPASTEPPATTSSPDAGRAVPSPTTQAPSTTATSTTVHPPAATIAEPPPASTTSTSTTRPTTTSTAPTTTTTSTSTTTTTTTVPPETEEEDAAPAVHEMSVTTVEFMPGLHADVHFPIRPGNYPVVALVFGGGWTVGDRTQLSALADYLASRGMVAVNGDHRTLLRGRRLPDMVGEVACLAAAAPHLAAPYLTGPPDPMWLLGYSSGAHLAALTTLTDPSPAPDCPRVAAQIAGMIGLGGPYDLGRVHAFGWGFGMVGVWKLLRNSMSVSRIVSRPSGAM